jgi:uncharacterized protein
MALLNAKCFAARGYMVLLVSCRGTAGSGGIFVAAMNEQADSQAVVKWMREQPWYPGKFATFGPSYLGYAQWALLRDPPKDLIASVILCSVYDHSLLVWTNGAYRIDRISWSYIVARQDEANGKVSSILDPRKLKSVIEATPLFDATESFLEGRALYQLEFMTTPNVDDPFWARCKHHAALDLVNTPLLLRSDWYDTLTVQTLTSYARARDRGVKVYLTVGPWTHTEACGSNAMPGVFDFLDEYVAGRKKNHRSLSVKVFVTGAEEWRSLPSWPPATEERAFYLPATRRLVCSPRQPTRRLRLSPTTPTIPHRLWVGLGWSRWTGGRQRLRFEVRSPRLHQRTAEGGRGNNGQARHTACTLDRRPVR